MKNKMLLLSVLGLTSSQALLACPSIDFICPGSDAGFRVDTSIGWDLSCHKETTLLNAAMVLCPNSLRCGPSWPDRADGCSVPVPGVNEVLSAIFNEACDLHDMCYSAKGNSKQFCDSAFNINLIQLCNIPGLNLAILPACVAAVEVMWGAVIVAGQSSYDNDQQWGERHCHMAQTASSPQAVTWYDSGIQAHSLKAAQSACDHLSKDALRWQLPKLTDVIEQQENYPQLIPEAMYRPFWVQEADIKHISLDTGEGQPKHTIVLHQDTDKETNVICMAKYGL